MNAAPDRLDALAAEFGFDPQALPVGARAAFAALFDRLADAVTLADLDPLTGLLNRRAFLREVARTASFVERYGGGAAVIFIDLDGFKAINDGFGHAAGDAMLRAVGQTLAANVRDSDAVGRLGGDEFGVLLARTNRAGAAAKTESLAARIAEAAITIAGRTHRIGASLGWHALCPGEDAEAALARADEAMYALKARTRGRGGARLLEREAG